VIFETAMSKGNFLPRGEASLGKGRFGVAKN